jgi:hypothetical protein
MTPTLIMRGQTTMVTMTTGQGIKTNNEDNHHKTMTGMKTEMHEGETI